MAAVWGAKKRVGTDGPQEMMRGQTMKDPTSQSWLKETHLKRKYIKRMKGKGWKTIYQGNVAIVIRQIDFF